MTTPSSFDVVAPEILRNRKHYLWCKDYIGAIDGTHIQAVVPITQATPYRLVEKMSLLSNGDLFIRYVFNLDLARTGVVGT